MVEGPVSLQVACRQAPFTVYVPADLRRDPLPSVIHSAGSGRHGASVAVGYGSSAATVVVDCRGTPACSPVGIDYRPVRRGAQELLVSTAGDGTAEVLPRRGDTFVRRWGQPPEDRLLDLAVSLVPASGPSGPAGPPSGHGRPPGSDRT